MYRKNKNALYFFSCWDCLFIIDIVCYFNLYAVEIFTIFENHNGFVDTVILEVNFKENIL